jgi:hypothetical protein
MGRRKMNPTNKRVSFLHYILFCIFISSCAHIEKQPREEWISAQTKTYNDITTATILEASERIFILSDESDFSFSYKPKELIALRNWSFYAILSFVTGTDVWRVQTQESNGKTVVTIELEINSNHFGGYSNKSGPAHTATYKTFWARLDYLLGLREDWMTCEQYEEMDPFSNQGLLYGLCGKFADNKTPKA